MDWKRDKIILCGAIIGERSHFCFPSHLNMIFNLIYFIPIDQINCCYLYQYILIHYILIIYNNFYLFLTFYNFYFYIYLLRWYRGSSDFIELYEKLNSR